MQFYLSIIFFFTFYLFFINFFLKKFNFSLDKEASNEKHKFLLRQDNTTPLSGTFYFLPIILIVFYTLDTSLIVFCSLLFILGFIADVKVITSYKIRLIFQFYFFQYYFYQQRYCNWYKNNFHKWFNELWFDKNFDLYFFSWF